MQDFNLCKAATVGMNQGAGWLKTKLLKHRFAVRVMKITAFLMFICMLEVSAKAPAQEKITIKEKGASLMKIFTQISKQTGYNFFFTSEDMKFAKPVDINVKNASLKDVLDICFKNQDLTYKISANHISVEAKKNDSPQIAETGASDNVLNIHGKVVDESGKPVAGVTVTIKGTKKQTITDENGNFYITGVETSAVVVFSAVNMEPFELQVGTETEIVAKLKTKTSELDEVQIIGYGQTTKRLQTGNVGSVKAVDIEKHPVNNPLLALQGRVPGLRITQNTGVPGGGITVRVQGSSSIRNGNDPLYVIDGVPYPSQIPSTGTGTDLALGNSGGMENGMLTGVGNPLELINPSDIESVDILKDADATAIYGSRGANGVILITTRRGKQGPRRINVDLQQGWGMVPHRVEMLKTSDYLDMRREAKKNDNSPVSSSDYDINGAWDSTRYTDWQKELIGRTAGYTNLNATVSGGNHEIAYLVGTTFRSENTVFLGNFKDQKWGVNLNISSGAQDQKFHFQVSSNYLIDNSTLPSFDFTTYAIALEPNAPALHNSDGSINWAPNNFGASTFRNNPLIYTDRTYESNTSSLVASTIIGYRVLSNLDIYSNFGYTKIQTDEYAPTPLTSIQPEFRPFIPRSARYGAKSIDSWIIEPQANYKCSLAGGKLDVLIGMTFQNQKSTGSSFLGSGYTTDKSLSDIHSAASIVSISSFDKLYKYDALFGRINYNLLDKYIINLTGRRDGSSRFGPANQFNDFGSVGIGWIFSNEKILKEKLPGVSFGKLRASYGTSGNDQIGDYTFLNLYVPPYFGVGVPYQGIPEIYPNALPNPYIAWEETRKLQIGIDLGLLHDRIIANITYSKNKSSNQLLSYALPSTTGFQSVIDNFPATIQNTGWEFAFMSTNIKNKNIKWTTDINLTIPRNKLTAFPNLATSSYAYNLVIGQPIDVNKLYHFVGVDPSTGKYVVADSHGNATATPSYLDDAQTLLSAMPKIYGGIENSITYKRISIDFLFEFVKQLGTDLKFYNNAYVSPGMFFAGFSNQPLSVLNRWQRPGDVTDIQKFSTNYFSLFTGIASDKNFTDASYLRLKNFSISWELPDIWKRKLHMQSFKIYAQGQNLLTFTPYKGLDPETRTSNALPPLRVIALGTRLTF